jgi:SAM-dependent methyltransferase
VKDGTQQTAIKEGGGHADESWRFYWLRLHERLKDTPFADLPGYIERVFQDLRRPLRILSLGSGDCGHELDLARRLRLPHHIVCTDPNAAIFAPAREAAARAGFNFEFREADLNFLHIEPRRYDLIFAHAVLHHVINLEHLFEQVAGGLSDRGLFQITEVIGENRKLLWDANQRLANTLLDALPSHMTRGMRLAVAAEAAGREGVRQEDILPLLHDSFSTVFEQRHGAFMRFICTHPVLGACFDVKDPSGLAALEFLIASDEAAVRHGILRPLEIWGLYRARARR